MMDEGMDMDMQDSMSKQTSLWESEYGHIIKWCQRFQEISVGVHFAPTSEVSKRMKIFMFLADKARKKDELMDPFDYFNLKVTCPSCDGDGCTRCKGKGILLKKPNKFSRTFNEKQIGDYVNYLHQKVLDLMNQKVVPNYLRGDGDE